MNIESLGNIFNFFFYIYHFSSYFYFVLHYFSRKSSTFDKNSKSRSRQLNYLQNDFCFSHLALKTVGGDRFLVGKMQFFQAERKTQQNTSI